MQFVTGQGLMYCNTLRYDMRQIDVYDMRQIDVYKAFGFSMRCRVLMATMHDYCSEQSLPRVLVDG